MRHLRHGQPLMPPILPVNSKENGKRSGAVLLGLPDGVPAAWRAARAGACPQ